MQTYRERPLDRYPFFDVENAFAEHKPDFIKWATYGLVAYRFPFETRFGEMAATPFFLYEYDIIDDTVPELHVVHYRGGFNFAPSSFLTLKYELHYTGFPKSEFFKEGMWIHAAQAAVSF